MQRTCYVTNTWNWNFLTIINISLTISLFTIAFLINWRIKYREIRVRWIDLERKAYRRPHRTRVRTKLATPVRFVAARLRSVAICYEWLFSSLFKVFGAMSDFYWLKKKGKVMFSDSIFLLVLTKNIKYHNIQVIYDMEELR